MRSKLCYGYGQCDRQETRRNGEVQGLTNEQNDRTNDEQKEGHRDRRTDGLNETQTEEPNDGHKDREENGLTDQTEGGLNEENEQTETQQQARATPDKAETRQSRGSNDSVPGAGGAGSEDGQVPKGSEHNGMDSRKGTMDEAGRQSEGDTKTQLGEVRAGEGDHQNDENFRSEEMGRLGVDMKTRSELKDGEGLDGAAEPESNLSKMPSGSPVAGRTRGKRRPKNVLEGQQLNSGTDGEKK